MTNIFLSPVDFGLTSHYARVILTPNISALPYGDKIALKRQLIECTVNGTASFSNLIPTVYRVDFIDCGSPHDPNYILVPEASGSTINANTLIVSPTYTIPSGSFNVISASWAKFAVNSTSASYFSGSISNAVTSVSSSYALTASYAANSSGGSGTTLTTGSTYQVTSSWSNQSLTASSINFIPLNVTSASYSSTASFALNGGGSGPTLITASTYQITSSNANTASYVFLTSTGSATNPPIQFSPNNISGQSQGLGIYNDAINSMRVVSSGATYAQFGNSSCNLRSNNIIMVDAAAAQLNNGKWRVVGNDFLVDNGLTASIVTSPQITGSLNGTASWANNTVSSSVATTSSYAVTASFALTSPATTLVTASTYQITSSWTNNVSASKVIGTVTSASFANTSSHVRNANNRLDLGGNVSLTLGGLHSLSMTGPGGISMIDAAEDSISISSGSVSLIDGAGDGVTLHAGTTTLTDSGLDTITLNAGTITINTATNDNLFLTNGQIQLETVNGDFLNLTNNHVTLHTSGANGFDITATGITVVGEIIGNIGFLSASLAPSGSTHNFTVDYNNAYYSITSSTDMTFGSSSNGQAVKSSVVYINAATGSRTVSFNSNWVFMNANAPTTIAANKAAVLSLTSFGSAENKTIAAYGVQQ